VGLLQRSLVLVCGVFVRLLRVLVYLTSDLANGVMKRNTRSPLGRSTCKATSVIVGLVVTVTDAYAVVVLAVRRPTIGPRKYALNQFSSRPLLSRCCLRLSLSLLLL
jgi:hypothetical protein